MTFLSVLVCDWIGRVGGVVDWSILVSGFLVELLFRVKIAMKITAITRTIDAQTAIIGAAILLLFCFVF
jgi:hypothetical protein